MKKGTIRSPFPYDAAARHALQSANLRRPAISRYASRAAVFPISSVAGCPPIAARTIDPEIDAKCQFMTHAVQQSVRTEIPAG